MKTPEALRAELEAISKDSFSVFLYVGFDNSSIVLNLYRPTGEVLADGGLVYERDPNFLRLLKEAIANGGVPIGWCRLKSKKSVGDTVELGPLQDNENESWAYEYLKGFFTDEEKKRYKACAQFYLVYPDGGLVEI